MLAIRARLDADDLEEIAELPLEIAGMIDPAVRRPGHGSRLLRAALVLEGAPTDGPTDPRTTPRPAAPDDVPRIEQLLAAGFGRPAAGIAERLGQPGTTDVVVERDAVVIGYLRPALDEWRSAVCTDSSSIPRSKDVASGATSCGARAGSCENGGAVRVDLEVEVANERALGLYTSVCTRRSGSVQWSPRTASRSGHVADCQPDGSARRRLGRWSEQSCGAGSTMR